LIEAEDLGLPAQTRHRHGDHLRVSAVAGEAGIPARAPDRGPHPVGRPRLDHAREITAGDARQRRLLHGPGDVLDVAGINRGRHDPHQCDRLADGRSRYLRQLKNGGIAEGLEPYRSHDLFFNHSNLLTLNCSAQPILGTNARNARLFGQCLTVVQALPDTLDGKRSLLQ
jgi:hypothetical protein